MLESAERFSSRNIWIWGLAAVLALWLAMTAVGGIAQSDTPGLALSVYPKSGFAYESRAARDVFGNGKPIQKMRVSAADLADARDALRREPFATSALTLIGLARGLQGDAAGATKIVAAAHGLDKRQLVANGWLINRYGTTGHDREVLALLDEALKISPALSAQYMPAFAQALQNPETIGAFQNLLSKQPPWAGEFWSTVSTVNASLPNAEVLRSRILAGREEIGPIDAMLMTAYVNAGRMDLALSYGKSLPALADDRENFVRNASFTQLPLLPPLDWDLINDGRIGAAIDEGRGTLEISALPGSAGTVARQLIALPPGNYALLVKLGRADLERGSEVAARIRCAEPGIASVPLNERMTTDLDQQFTVPDAGCRFFWLELDFSATDSSEPVLGSIAEARIVRGRPPAEN